MRLLQTSTYRSVPRRISELTSHVTPESDLFVLAHLAIPLITEAEWSLDITGLVRRPMRLWFADLADLPVHDLMSVHKCAGNPMKPTEPTPDRVGNVIWSGVRLRDVLDRCGCAAEASQVWADGFDSGIFEGVVAGKYQKDIPLQKAMDDTLLATKINGMPLGPTAAARSA